jgi:hypothetical protein
MPTNLTTTLRKALAELEAKRARLDRQITGIRQILAEGGRGQGRRVPTRRRAKTRKPMSAAARKALSRRMKAYWAKRRAGAAKSKARGAQAAG